MEISLFRLKYYKEGLTPAIRRAFQSEILRHYKRHGRHDLPWRKTRDPYKILVSEIMLQQTQVKRVVSYYKEFLKKFPTIKVLAKAPLKDVLKVWQGLGYNRRALFLKRLAEDVVKNDKGKIPAAPQELIELPGIGINTAGAILAYAFGKPAAFIETNVRSVYIYFFLNRKEKITDKEILSLVAKTIDVKNPREWYFALMDYGTMLKASVGNPNIKSKHYIRQSKFKGSLREARGAIIKLLNQHKNLSADEFVKKSKIEKERIVPALASLKNEGFLNNKGKNYFLRN